MPELLALFPAATLPAPLTHFAPHTALPDLAERVRHLRRWQQAIQSGYVRAQKEEALQAEFLNLLFGQVLGYEYQATDHRQLQLELKTLTDGTKPDGALGEFVAAPGGNLGGPVRAVVELKDARTPLDAKQRGGGGKGRAETPVEQAFSYPSKFGGACRWVLVSNFVELRLYAAQDQTRAEVFQLDALPDQPDQLRRFFALLLPQHLLPAPGSATAPLDEALQQRQQEELKITKAFYKDYSTARRQLLDHLIEQNPAVPPLELLAHTQKLLDRVIFVCFCEDKNIIPRLTFRRLLDAVRANVFDPADDKVYRTVRGLFRSIDEGNPAANINRFNGGLFAPDAALDGLTIKDRTLTPVIQLEQYDFASDLNVNILGHIFEQSLSDLEAERARLSGQAYDQKQGKRKQDGIFYTPEYITRYIVRQAVGGWLLERRRHAGLDELPDLTDADRKTIGVNQQTKRLLTPSKNVQQHLAAWETYSQQLKSIRVLDPACGSGAFLNEAFGYLLREGQVVNDALAELRAGQRELFDLDRHILQHNLYGVDLNPESVDITRLSLWLQTANPGRPLTSLDHSIRCGNSLIADPAVAGPRAFDWRGAFPEVFAQGGFDVVIGNPPYVQSHALDEMTKTYIYRNYKTAEYQINTYGIFLEQSQKLSNDLSYYGFIVPNYWISTKYDSRLRRMLIIENNLREIVNTYQIFEGANVDTVLITGINTHTPIFPKSTLVKSVGSHLKSINSRLAAIEKQEWQTVNSFQFSEDKEIVEISLEPKLSLKGVDSLGNLFSLKKGMQPYELGKGSPPQTSEMMNNQVYDASYQIDETYKPLLRARNIKRYFLDWGGDWIKYGKNLAAPRVENIFSGERILFRRIISTSKIEGLFIDTSFINNTDIIVMKPKNATIKTKAISGIIMSSICSTYLRKENINLSRSAFPKINVGTIESFPIPNLDEASVIILEKSVDNMLAGHKALHEAEARAGRLVRAELGLSAPLTGKLALTQPWKTWSAALEKALGRKLSLPEKSTWLDYLDDFQQQQQQRRAALLAQDAALDQLVYQLYQLTPEEIALVEAR